ncbi:hypothetical protein FZW96_03235 [Bacillus sp. BGMRC 2118]|nr:hypothetical protein FZW96_03235 [Bacillus sp. BGMRC 2118]
MEIILLSALGIVILIAGIIWTIVLAGKNDENYSTSTKGNITRLTLIYIGLVVLLVIGIGLYLYLN